MLKLDPQNLMQEIEAAERLRKRHLEMTDLLIREYHGGHYDTERKPDFPTTENHAFEWLSIVTPQVCFDNPDVNIRSRRSGVDRTMLTRMKYAIEQWTEDVYFWRTLQDVWFDLSFSFGVINTTLEHVPYYQEQNGIRALRPACNRIAPHRFIVDALAGNDPARFKGHMWIRDKDDLLQDQDFDPVAVEELIADAGMEKDRMPGDNQNSINAPNRNQINCYDIWIPEVQMADPAEGYNGTIYTLAGAVKNNGDAAEPRWIRKPRPFFGPRCGPYTLFGAYVVPGQVYPLSPLAATHAQNQELNSHAVAAGRDAASYKRFVAYDPAFKEAAQSVKEVSNGGVVAVPGLKDGAIKDMEVGGVAKQQYDYIAMLRDRRDRSTGLRESDRGGKLSAATATEITDSAEQRDSRIALLKRLFQTSTKEALNNSAWYMWNSEFVVFPLGDEAAQEINPRPSYLPPESQAEELALQQNMPVEQVRQNLQWNPTETFKGGETFHHNSMLFEELMLDIEAYSMERVNQTLLQARVKDMVQTAITAIPVMAQFPTVDWETLWDKYGQSINDNDLGSIFAPFIQQLKQTMQAQQQQVGVLGAGAQGMAPTLGGGPANVNPAAMMGGQLAQAQRVA